MAETLRCTCGVVVPFEDEDRGLDVYCPSCGKMCRIPVEPNENLSTQPVADTETPSPDRPDAPEASPETPPTDSPVNPPDPLLASDQSTAEPSSPSVFSGAVAADMLDRFVDEVSCLCGTKIQVRIKDFGNAVYCPSCASEVRVGEDLERARASRARVSPEEEAVSAPVPRTRFRLIRSPLGLAAMMLIFASMGGGGYVTWNNRAKVLQSLGVLEPPAPSPGKAGEHAEFDPAKLTLTMIQDLATEEDPWKALTQTQAWERGLRECGVPEANPRYDALAEVMRQVLDLHKSNMLDTIVALAKAEDPDTALKQTLAFAGLLRSAQLPDDDERLIELQRISVVLIERVHPITLEMIAALLETADAQESLIQAQVWREELRDRDVQPEDVRRKKLADVIEELETRLVPLPKTPPPCLAEFCQAVQELSEQLKAENLDGARQARDRAQALLDEHPDDLSDRARRFFVLKARLRDLLAFQEGVSDIRRLFGELEKLIATGNDDQVEAALRLKAQVQFRVSITPVTPEEAAEFTQRMRELSMRLKFARGKRAVRDAERCNGLNDLFARDHEVRRAYELLPGCGDDKTRPLFKRIEDWYKGLEGKNRTGARPAKPTSSFGWEIALRDVFERPLEHFGKDDAQERLLAACSEAAAVCSEARIKSDPRCADLATMLAEVLEANLTAILLAERGVAELEIARRLRSIQKTLDQASPWIDSSRLKSLSGTLSQHASEWGERAIQKATQLAEKGQLAEAIDTISPAVDLAGPSVSQRARSLHQRWIAEKTLRDDKQAEAAAWKKIQSLVAEDAREKELEAWFELVQFARRYPKSTRFPDAKALANRIRAAVEKAFDRQVEAVTKAARQGRWSAVFPWMPILESAAVAPEQRDRLGNLSQLIAGQRQRAEREYRLMGTQRRMFTEEQVIEVRRILIQYLLIHEDDLEAQELLEIARQKGAVRAERLLAQAMTFKNIRPESYREKLKRAFHLDPDGPHGAKALDMLQHD